MARRPAKFSPFLAALPVGGARITVGAEPTGGSTINVQIQLTDANARDIGHVGHVQAYLSDNADGSTLAGTAPSGGWAIGTDGLLLPIVANKFAHLVSEADGDIDITITESGADTWYLCVMLPNGTLVISSAITFSDVTTTTSTTTTTTTAG